MLRRTLENCPVRQAELKQLGLTLQVGDIRQHRPVQRLNPRPATAFAQLLDRRLLASPRIQHLRVPGNTRRAPSQRQEPLLLPTPDVRPHNELRPPVPHHPPDRPLAVERQIHRRTEIQKSLLRRPHPPIPLPSLRIQPQIGRNRARPIRKLRSINNHAPSPTPTLTSTQSKISRPHFHFFSWLNFSSHTEAMTAPL